MYKLFISLSLIFFLAINSFAQFVEIKNENVVSEGKFYLKDNKLYTDRIVVKFKTQILNLNEQDKKATRFEIDEKHSNVNKLLNDLAISYGEMDIIKKIPSANANDLQRTHKRTGENVTIHDMSQLYDMKFPNPVPVDSTVKSFQNLTEVEFAHQPVSIQYLVSPNDSIYLNGEQWSLDVINAEGAWAIEQGSEAVKIAIIDDGSDKYHEDLFTKIERFDGNISDHGTEVAGVAAAITNNQLGMASLGWRTKLFTYGGDHVNDIYTAVSKGADIINMSWLTVLYLTESDIRELMGACPRPEDWNGAALPWNYPEVECAIEDASSQGVLLIAGAGNKSKNEGPNPELCDPWKIPFQAYPAAYEEVIAVSATWMESGPEGFVDVWNYGNYIDFSAPGYSIYTRSLKINYIHKSGTSFSAPLVCALASLIIAKDPYENIYDVIKKTCDKIDNFPYDINGWNQYLGFGRINAESALKAVFPDAPTGLSLSGSQGQSPTLSWNANSESDLDGYKIYRKDGSASEQYLTSVSETTTQFTDNGITIGGPLDQSIRYRITAYDQAGNESGKSNAVYTTAGGINSEQVFEELSAITPNEFTVLNAYPNPFNPSTTIKYFLPDAKNISIAIYNLAGERIFNKTYPESDGWHTFTWSMSATEAASGIHFVKISTVEKSVSQKILLIK